MKTVCVIGQWCTGKSYAIFEAAKWLWQKNSQFELTDVPFDKELYAGREYIGEYSDLRTLFFVNGKRILFYSATDNEDCIKGLKNTLTQLSLAHASPDILVTSCRRFDDKVQKTLLDGMKWHASNNLLFDNSGNEIIQIPVLRVRHELNSQSVIEWYNSLTAHLLQKVLEMLIFN